MKYVTKDNGKSQVFNSKKLSNSIKKTLISNYYDDDQASSVANSVTDSIMRWMLKKSEITTLDIRNHTSKELAKIDKHSALVYKKHKDLW